MRLEPLVLYHPSKAGGSAFQLEARVPAAFDDQGRVLRDSIKQGGCFATWAQQEPGSGVGREARFAWKDGWTVKLGLADITSWLSARERVRFRGLDVERAKAALLYERLHRSGEGANAKVAVIRYQFDAEAGGVLGLSYSKEDRRSIKLTDEEEFTVARYLQLVLDGFLTLGKR